ncbi:Hypothetical protein PHPALM_13445, partial [Phytophthora palmivora]
FEEIKSGRVLVSRDAQFMEDVFDGGRRNFGEDVVVVLRDEDATDQEESSEPEESKEEEAAQDEYFTSIRILLSLAAKYNLTVHQMDVKTAFLNGWLDEDIYMVQPDGFIDEAHPDFVCKLKRSLYGLNVV